jgi:predicted permease
MIAQLAAILIPVLACVGLGYAWHRHGGAFDADLVTRLVTGIGAPALVFHAVAGLDIGADAFARVAGAWLATMLTTGLAGMLALRLWRQPLRPFLPVVLFPNTGNVGLPLSLLAFGDAGLGFAVAIFAITALAQLTLGVGIAAGRRQGMAGLVRLPLIWALAAALAFVLVGRPPPQWLAETARLLAGMAIPLMLLTLGVSLASLRIAGLRLSLGLAVLRLGLGFGLGVGAAQVFGLAGAAAGVLVLQSAMPTAVFNYLFARRYDTRPIDVAGAVVVSTLLSFAVLPLILAHVLGQAG